MRKILALILAICLCICTLSVPAFADDTFNDAFAENGILYDKFYTHSDAEGETTSRVSINKVFANNENNSVGLGKDAWVAYKMDFGTEGARVFSISYGITDTYAGGTFTLYLDNMTNDPFMSIIVESTGGFNVFVPHEFVLSEPIYGQHTLYIKGSKGGTGNINRFTFKKGYTEIAEPALIFYDSKNVSVDGFAGASKLSAEASVLNYAYSDIDANLVMVPYDSSFKRTDNIKIDSEENINDAYDATEFCVEYEDLSNLNADSIVFAALLDNSFKTIADSAFVNKPTVEITRSTEKDLDYYINGTSVTLYGDLGDESESVLIGLRNSDVSLGDYANYEFIYEASVSDGKYEHTFTMDDDTPTDTYTAVYSTQNGMNSVDFHYSRPGDIVDAFYEINSSKAPYENDDDDDTTIDKELMQWKDTLGLELDYIESNEKKDWMYAWIYSKLPFEDLNALNDAVAKVIFLNKINTGSDILETMDVYKTTLGITGDEYYKTYFKDIDKDILASKMRIVIKHLLPLSDTDKFTQIFRESVVLTKMSNQISWGSIDAQIADFIDTIDSEYIASYIAMEEEYRKIASKELLNIDFNSIKEISDLFEKGYKLALEEKKDDEKSVSGGGSSGGGSKKTYEVEAPKKEEPEIVVPQPVEPEEVVISFNDMQSHAWANDAVIYLAENGIVSGKSEGMFCPADTITREEFVKILVMALGGNTEGAQCSFGDVGANSWYYPYIATAFSKGWINGFEDGTFGVGKSITREQMATIFHRAILDVDGAPDVVNSSVSFVDYRQIGSWAADAVMNLAKAGLINGKGMGMFSPLSSASRAETASLVYKYLISR